MLRTRCAHLDKASVDVDQAMMLNFDLVRNRFLGFDLLGTLLSCVVTFVSVVSSILSLRIDQHSFRLYSSLLDILVSTWRFLSIVLVGVVNIIGILLYPFLVCLFLLLVLLCFVG
jgi:hypothetical protein